MTIQQDHDGFRTSSFSANGENCVAVKDLPGGGRLVRNSKDPAGPVVAFTVDEWQAFIAGVKAGEFD